MLMKIFWSISCFCVCFCVCAWVMASLGCEVTIEDSDSDDDGLLIKRADFDIWEWQSEMDRSMVSILFDPETE